MVLFRPRSIGAANGTMFAETKEAVGSERRILVVSYLLDRVTFGSERVHGSIGLGGGSHVIVLSVEAVVAWEDAEENPVDER